MKSSNATTLLHFFAATLAILWLGSARAASYTDYSDDTRNPAMAPIQDRPGLPRVLLIGDSISIGYTVPVRAMLAGTTNVHRIPENGGSTTNGLAKLDNWLGTNRWDVIHFNWGLHDLKLNDDGSQWVRLDSYETNLRRLIARLKRTGAKLVFATTTPVPQGVRGVKRDAVDPPRYNEVARRIMERDGVAIDDLYLHALPRLDAIQIPVNVHFKTEGSAVLATAVATSIRTALQSKPKSP